MNGVFQKFLLELQPVLPNAGRDDTFPGDIARRRDDKPVGSLEPQVAVEDNRGAIVCTRKPPNETSTHRPGSGSYVNSG